MKIFLIPALLFATSSAFAQDIPKCDPPKTCPYEMHPGHWMCGPCQKESKGSVSVHGDQYFSAVATPDETVAVAPGHWMVEAEIPVGKRVKARLNTTFSPDRLTFPENGMPYPGMVGDGYSQHQHPHELVSRAEACLEVGLGEDRKITGCAGPVVSPHTAPFFAMAPSARGNMLPRQSHHSADSQHATPGGVHVTAAYVTGHDPDPRTAKIETYRPDSFTVGVERGFGNVKVGAIAGRINHRHNEVGEHHQESGEQDVADEVERQLLATVYVTTQHNLAGGSLDTTTLYTRTRNLDRGTNSDGFSTEGAYRRGKGAFGGRFEIVDRDCLELGLHCVGQHKLKQYQGFAERQFAQKGGAKFYFNGSVTYADMPEAFGVENSLSAQGGVRVEFTRSFSFGKSAR
jgi:hypothetical protein